MTHITVVSSPGKVLIAGGYLVLDPKYSGIVVSTSSRFYTAVQAYPGSANRIRVRSPQFVNAIWEYSVTAAGASVVVEDAVTNTSKNKFVHLALQNTIAIASELSGISSVIETLSTGIDIVIVGDNDFYSQRKKLSTLDRTFDSLSKIPPFSPTDVTLSDIHKTGLGSSAALITSLVSALLVHFSTIPATSFTHNSDGQRLAHNLAQYVHCLAQGKVGSGFDVSAAVFGSHIYTRFNPEVIHDLMNNDALPSQFLSPVLLPSNPAWDYRVQQFKLPPLTRIMLADVDAGSNTPSFVGLVLRWRKEKPSEAHELWTALDQFNQSLAHTLLELSSLYDKDPETYTIVVKYISSLRVEQWNANPSQTAEEQLIISHFAEAHRLSQEIRKKMREMGTASTAEIEPEQQTNLLDRCISLPGVIGGGVPGAGGYDAIWLLVCEPVDPSPDMWPWQRVENLWKTRQGVSPLSAGQSLAGGTRIEELDKIPGLSVAVGFL